jgi:hypothetical protein
MLVNIQLIVVDLIHLISILFLGEYNQKKCKEDNDENAFDNAFYSYVENLREKSKQHLSTINLLNTNPNPTINNNSNSINGRKSIGNNYINDQLSFDNRNYMKINPQTQQQHQQQDSNLNHNLVSSLREKFETKINLNNNTEPKTILTKLNHRSQSLASSSSTSSSSSTISTSPISPVESVKITIKTPILSEIQTENKYLSTDSSASAASSLPSPQIQLEIIDSNNEKNLLSYFLSLNSIKSINQVLFNNFVYKYLLKFYYSENNIKKFVYLNLIKPLNESCSNDDNDFYRYSIDYAKNLLLLVGNKDFIIEKIENNNDFINGDDEKCDFSSPTELLFELKTKYLFELNKIIEKKLNYYIGKENFLHKKIDFNKNVSNKVTIYA